MDAYIGLGANLGDRPANLRLGLAGMRERGLDPVATSSVWESEPEGTTDAAWFLNMVVRVVADRAPLDLMDDLLEIERRAGRVRTVPNAPRTLDLDLLLVDGLQVRHPRLHLPHPRMWERRFVLEPLGEIAPDLRNPASGRTVAEERRRLRGRGAVFRLGRLATSGGRTL